MLQAEDPTDWFVGLPQQTESDLPRGAVRVYYDELRAPHIFADTDEGVFYGLGYTQVRDFPVATLANLWSTTGRFAEIAGPRVLKRDLRVRVWGLDEVARRQAQDENLLEPEIKELLEAYVAGVNAGRNFWLERPEMIDRLIGDEGQVWVDPVPPWMNPTYTGNDAKRILVNMLERGISLLHVLTLGVALNGGTEYFGGGYAFATNVWLIRNPAKAAGLLALMDAHQPIKRDGLRSYPVQLHGARFRMSGISMPGYPSVFSGFSDEFFFGLSTPPKTPGPILSVGAPFRLNGRVPQTTMRWGADLEPGEPLSVLVDGKTPNLLEKHTVLLRALDPGTGKVVDDPEGVRHFYRVPLLRSELEGFGLGYPVTSPPPGVKLDLATHTKIVFEGRSYLASRNAMETFLKIGYSKRTGAMHGGVDRVLAGSRLSYGRAEVFLAGDVEGGMEYVMLTHAPVPGRAASKARTWIGDFLVDGRDSSFRWGGFPAFNELARLAQPAGFDDRNDVWLNCNTSPHYVRRPGAQPEFSFDGPGWLYDDQAWKTLRHDRARTLFDRLGPRTVIRLEDIQRISLDTQDGWMERMWPWIAAMREDSTLSLEARAILDWFDEERLLDADRQPGRDPFMAHVSSRVMPYITLLMGRFEDHIAALAGAEAHEIAFAYDPSSDLPSPEEFSTDERWVRTHKTLRDALENVASLWSASREGKPSGLVTQHYLAQHEACDSAIQRPWRNTQDLKKSDELLWGDVNLYLMTPHVLPKPLITAREAWLQSILVPCSFDHLPAYYKAQRTAIAAVRGTRTSIFHAHSQSLFRTDEKLFSTNKGLVYLVPVDFASQVLFVAEMRPGKTARARMLPSMGATEILIDLPENGTRADDHFAPFEDFLKGKWTDFPQEESRLKERNHRWYSLEKR